jgi:anti-sigma-K factor RskA
MNTTADDGNNHLRYAEYVLGVLDADARAAVAHEIATTDEAATAVALWQRRLMPLADTIVEVTPAPYGSTMRCSWTRQPESSHRGRGFGKTCSSGIGSASAPASWRRLC